MTLNTRTRVATEQINKSMVIRMTGLQRSSAYYLPMLMIYLIADKLCTAGAVYTCTVFIHTLWLYIVWLYAMW